MLYYIITVEVYNARTSATELQHNTSYYLTKSKILNSTLFELAFLNGKQNTFDFRIVPLYYYVNFCNIPTLNLRLSNVIFWISFGKHSSRSVPLIISLKYIITIF